MEERGKSSRFRSPAAFAVASIASASAYLWVRIPVGREVQHSFANFCANLQMKPQDWPCQVTPARSIAFYLVASLLVWLAVAIPCAVLASTGRRVTALRRSSCSA